MRASKDKRGTLPRQLPLGGVWVHVFDYRDPEGQERSHTAQHRRDLQDIGLDTGCGHSVPLSLSGVAHMQDESCVRHGLESWRRRLITERMRGKLTDVRAIRVFNYGLDVVGPWGAS